MDVYSLKNTIACLEQIRQSRVILYLGQDRGMFPHRINEDDVVLLFKCLRKIGQVERLDVVLYTGGGNVVVARKISLLLRSYGMFVSILVPYKARSSGTLLCLGANEIVMGPLAELSPIDPHLIHVGTAPQGSSPMISSADIREFRRMANVWFGIKDEEQSMDILRLLCNRIFPASLTSFFHAGLQMHKIANELLQFQLPQVDREARQNIVEHLISAYYSHEYSITREEAVSLGLQVSFASLQEEDLLWNIWEMCYEHILAPTTPPTAIETDKKVSGLIASTDFLAHHVVYFPKIGNHVHANERQDRSAYVEMRWEIIEHC